MLYLPLMPLPIRQEGDRELSMAPKGNKRTLTPALPSPSTGLCEGPARRLLNVKSVLPSAVAAGKLFHSGIERMIGSSMVGSTCNWHMAVAAWWGCWTSQRAHCALRNNTIFMTSKMTLRHHFDIVVTLLFRHVSAWLGSPMGRSWDPRNADCLRRYCQVIVQDLVCRQCLRQSARSCHPISFNSLVTLVMSYSPLAQWTACPWTRSISLVLPFSVRS